MGRGSSKADCPLSRHSGEPSGQPRSPAPGSRFSPSRHGLGNHRCISKTARSVNSVSVILEDFAADMAFEVVSKVKIVGKASSILVATEFYTDFLHKSPVTLGSVTGLLCIYFFIYYPSQP